MNDIRLCYFKFLKKMDTKSFFKYRVKNLANYDIDIHKLNNRVRYKIISNFKNYICYNKMFVYSDKKENYIYTFNEIKNIPDLSDMKAELEFIEKIEIPVEENTDLYSAWIEYYVYNRISKLKKYDCDKENNFYLDIDTPKNNLSITLRREFSIKGKVMPDGTSYIGLNISTQYYSNLNVYERIKKGENLIGKEVTCRWQLLNRTYEIAEISDKNINETSESGFNLYNYWQELAPSKLKKIDPNNTKMVIVINHKEENRKEKYIPQSLNLIFRNETIAACDSKFSKSIDKLTKLPMNKRLEIMLNFINDLNSETNGNVIPEPVTAGEFGYSIYNTVSNIPKLLIGNKRKILFNEKYKVFSNEFYRMPNDEIIIGFMYFDKKKNECCKVINTIIDYLLKGTINGEAVPYLKKPLLPLKYSTNHYIYNSDNDKLSLEIQAKEILKSKKINFVVCIVPMESEDDEYSTDKSNYDIFKQVFADVDMPSQMISLKKFNSNNNINSYLKNIALGILGKSGGVPWVFEKPFSNVDCFIGIDVGTQSTGIHYPACSVCFDGKGNILGYYKTKKAQSGEKINKKVLFDIFDKVLIEYNEKNGHYPEHIVIHRDGFSNESNEWYDEYFSSKSIKYDLVEVKKKIFERLIDNNNPNGMNPDAGMCIIKDNTAIIVTTQRNSNYGGAPQPLEIIHKHGSLSINEIVSQIYALSELHIGSINGTRLPITTYYSDRICKSGDYIPKGNVYDKLYFL